MKYSISAFILLFAVIAFAGEKLSVYKFAVKSSTLHPYTFTYNSRSAPQNGYYFLSQKSEMPTDSAPNSILLLNTKGHLVYFQKTNLFKRKPGYQELTIEFQYDPRFGFIYLHGYKKPNELLQSAVYFLNKKFELIDTLQCLDSLTFDGHDIFFNKNNEALLTCLCDTIMDVSAIDTAATKSVEGLVIQVLDANKRKKFEWSSFEHFPLTDIDEFYLQEEYNPSLIDWIHPNSITENTHGDILVSIKHFNQLVLINRASGKVMWRLGGKNSTFKFTNDKGFNFQHHCRFLPNGNITLFDNGFLHTKPYSRAVEYSLDTLAMTATKTWEYDHGKKYLSEGKGSVQRLESGETVISWGNIQLKGPELTVVNKENKLQTELKMKDITETYSGYFYPLDFEIEQPKLILTREGADFYLIVSGKYKNYIWSTGELTDRIKVSKPGNYFVYTNAGLGMLSSEIKTVAKEDLQMAE